MEMDEEQNSHSIKSEVQSNGEILLFYVDENGGNEEGILTTIENIEHGQIETFQNFMPEEAVTPNDDTNLIVEQGPVREKWLDEEIKRLLVFYTDNKETFQNGPTRKKHLWTVACKTMLIGKTPQSCEVKLRNLKQRFALICVEKLKDVNAESKWPYFDLCQQAFHDDDLVKSLISENSATSVNVDTLFKTKKPRTADDAVMQMLTSYYAHKQNSQDNSWQKNFWIKIASELGEDVNYWHKRFLNFKQRYIRILETRKESTEEDISWPYMQIFDKIFENDVEFQFKYGNKQNQVANFQTQHNVKGKTMSNIPKQPVEWDHTEKTVLVKYCFDSYEEFQDQTIPNSFLWHEVGRLLDKNADECRKKYKELKCEHLDLYLAGGYNVSSRKPLAILLDNIISKDVELLLSKNKSTESESWETEQADILVNFFYDNIEVFKDSVCHFVCYAAIAKHLDMDVESCRQQWQELVLLYKSILEYKKEDPSLQIDWRYIDIFDRIFDYGMDTKLLEGYEKPIEEVEKKEIVVKKIDIKFEGKLNDKKLFLANDEEYIPESSGKKQRNDTKKQIQLLEYYLKNKDKFSSTQRIKNVLWKNIGKQIGMSAEQCAKMFTNLKKVYIENVQSEINKPDKPIAWPYYSLCKKVFGYRAIKNKLKNGSMELDDTDDWTVTNIHTLINYFGKNFHEISTNPEILSNWADLAKEIGKTEMVCKEKFLDLRKTYRKLKTMKTKNPGCKVSWKYFKMFEEIYSKESGEPMDVESSGPNMSLGEISDNMQDEDFQCIIVIPEGQEITDLSNAEIIIQENQDNKLVNENKKNPKLLWNLRTKKALLKQVFEYVKKNQGKVINAKEMWSEIAKHLDKTPRGCRTMYIKLKKRYKEQKEDSNEKYVPLLKKILALKPKFVSPITEQVVSEEKTYTDVPLPLWKTEKALKYYLEHLEEFVHPKYDPIHAWNDLGKFATLNAPKAFKKINYLKQVFNSETNEVNGEKFEFPDLLKEILNKEVTMKTAIANEPKPVTEEESDVLWTDEETDTLLQWYLENLNKFKNPKFVPSYLWMEASNVLRKSAVACSNKMIEIRSQYSSMVKECPEALNSWRFHELCQKIYGTGKKSVPTSGD